MQKQQFIDSHKPVTDPSTAQLPNGESPPSEKSCVRECRQGNAMKKLAPFLNRIVHGDCIEVLRGLPTNTIDLVVTDPPYLVNYQSSDGRVVPNDNNDRWLRPAFVEVARVLKPDRFCVSFYGWSKAERFLTAWKACGLYPVGHFVWVKPYVSRQSFTRMCHEQAYLLAKGRPLPPRHVPEDVLSWRYSGNRFHPTQKPVEAIVPLIEAYSQPGDVVLDPFAGSGTTAIAARRQGRRFILIEKHWPYYQAACKQIGQR